MASKRTPKAWRHLPKDMQQELLTAEGCTTQSVTLTGPERMMAFELLHCPDDPASICNDPKLKPLAWRTHKKLCKMLGFATSGF